MKLQTIRRVIQALVVLLVVTLAGLVYAFYARSVAATSYEEAQRQRVLSYQLAMEMRQSSDDLTRMVRAYVMTGKPDYERQYNAVLNIRNGKMVRPVNYHLVYWDMVDPDAPSKPRPDSTETASLQTLLQRAGVPDSERALVTASEKASNTLAQLEIQAMNMVKGLYEDANGQYTRADTPNREKAMSLVFGHDYTVGRLNVMKPLGDFFAAMESRVAETVAAAEAAQEWAKNFFYAMAGAGLLLMFVLMAFIRKQAALELAETTAAQKKAEDENEALNDSVIMILQAVHQLSERDLTVKAPVTEDVIGTVSDSINALASETARVLHGVTGIADQVALVSNNVKTQAGLVAQTAEDERAGVQMMVESLLDATQTMNRVAALAEQSNESAGQATLITDNALNTVNDTVKGMESIRETIAETEKRIKRLGERSQEISGIVNLINTISERTHVLALNASMQAAVAGEAGRGFAVVAEEVQRLAESSRNATQQIATLVGNIQLETNETINTVNQTIGQVVHGSEQAQKAGEQMRRTQEITAQLVSQVYNIAQASEQQKSMSVTLLEAVQRIGDSTEQTARQIEAQNKETDTLQQAAAALLESVHVFKLPPQAA